MAELKGSKTHANLKEAFGGESMANRRYLFFARRAETQATLVIITHDAALADRCERVVTLADGRIASDNGG